MTNVRNEIVKQARSKIELNIFLSNEEVKGRQEKMTRAFSDDLKKAIQKELDWWLARVAWQREFLANLTEPGEELPSGLAAEFI